MFQDKAVGMHASKAGKREMQQSDHDLESQPYLGKQVGLKRAWGEVRGVQTLALDGYSSFIPLPCHLHYLIMLLVLSRKNTCIH